MKKLNREEHPIRTLRIDRRTTQLELAKMLRISQAKLSQYETSAIHTPYHIINEIARIFKVSNNELREQSNNFFERKKEELMRKFRC
jgi:transcriptional regulator with XRE-family HTH domain